MKFTLWTLSLVFLVTGTLTQDGFDLSDALDDLVPATPKPKDQPPPPAKPDTDDGLDLSDAFDFGPAETPTKKPVKPAKPAAGDSDGFGLDLEDALGPDPNPKPDKPPAHKPNSGGGGGSFDDSDLADTIDGGFKPEGGGGNAGGSDYNDGGADQPQEAGAGPIAGIVSAVGVAVMGAATSYFAYQKKKLCFKIQGGVDPEAGKGTHGARSDNQIFSNLLRTH